MTVSPKLVATTKTVGNWHGVPPQRVVAIPPSDLDTLGKIRVLVNGVLVVRDYDPVLEQP